MLTNVRRDVWYIGAVLLVLLVLIGLSPLLSEGYANATEGQNSVDITYDGVNYFDENGELITDENVIKQLEKENITSSDDQKTEKNDQKSEDDSDSDKSDEESNVDSTDDDEADNMDEMDAADADDDEVDEDINDSDENLDDEDLDEEDSDAIVDSDDADDDNTDSDPDDADDESEVDDTDADEDEDLDAMESDDESDIDDVEDAEDAEVKTDSEDPVIDEESQDMVSEQKLDSDAEDEDGLSDDDMELATSLDDQDDVDEQNNDPDGAQLDSKKDADADESEDANNADASIDEFPEDYQSDLEELKEAHPTWNFIPGKTGLTWKEALDAEDEGSRNLVSPEEPKNQRESSDKRYDGRWYKANRETIAHYMDPRNFLNEEDIYQFLVQTYEEGAQNEDTVSDVIEGSFMEDGNPGGDYDSYAECINEAGKEAGVNPNVLGAMIIMEQGWDGSSLVSGDKAGYKGYYNFYNIGAYTTSTMSSVERGLWYAKGEGEGKDSYNRAWDSPYKSIEGGAEFYKENYIDNNQNTYYTKKYNVMNGKDEVGEHQYMTNVEGAQGEGKLMSRAYKENNDMSLTFEIPIYDNMPKNLCKLP